MIINLAISEIDALKCYHCQSSNMYTDLNCHVEQTSKISLKECNANQSSCVHIKYEGKDQSLK